MSQRIAVVLFNLGGPDNPDAIRPFLFNLFADPAIIRIPNPARVILAWAIAKKRTRQAKSIYAELGGGSPSAHTEARRGAGSGSGRSRRGEGLHRHALLAPDEPRDGDAGE